MPEISNLLCPVPFEVAAMSRKVGDHVLVKLSWGRIVEATVKAIRETTEGIRLQMSFSVETALIYAGQVVEEGR